MNLCSDRHDEICFEGKICPVCELKSELESVQKEAEELEKELKEVTAEARAKIKESSIDSWGF